MFFLERYCECITTALDSYLFDSASCCETTSKRRRRIRAEFATFSILEWSGAGLFVFVFFCFFALSFIGRTEKIAKRKKSDDDTIAYVRVRDAFRYFISDMETFVDVCCFRFSMFHSYLGLDMHYKKCLITLVTSINVIRLSQPHPLSNSNLTQS